MQNKKTNRSYKYRLIPNNKQKDAINTIFENCYFVRKLYQQDVSTRAMPARLKDLLAEYKSVYPQLRTTDSLALMAVLFKSSDEFQRGKLEDTSRMKKSYKTANYPYGDYFKILDSRHIYLPKVGEVEIILHRKFPSNSRMLDVTVTREADGNYYACIDFEITKDDIPRQLDKNNSIGLDYSSTHFVVDSNGKEYNAPHFYRAQLERLTEKRKELDRCVKNSANYFKKKKEIMKIHSKIQRCRRHHLHQLSTKMVNDYDYIFVEDINLAFLTKNDKLRNATKDNSYGEFIKMLEYKAKDKNKIVKRIDRWYPSSKTCHVCGNVIGNLNVDTKQWTCPACGSLLDRDENAAINIKNEGLRNIPSSRR